MRMPVVASRGACAGGPRLRPAAGMLRRWRPWLPLLAMLPALAAVAAPPGPVRDPYWGTALFELYQDHRHAALVDVMVSQALGRLPVQGDEAEVLRGGLLLDLGLEREAERALQDLVARVAGPEVRDRAWFHIARLRHRAGRGDEALAALGRIGDSLPAELRDARALLEAQLRLDRGEPAAAAAALEPVSADSPALPYARFNLAIARLRLGEAAPARALLEALGRQRTDDEALRSLRDKANLALGTLALREGDPSAAREALARIRLQGPSADAALLAYGWAALQARDPGLAVAAFDELTTRSSVSSAVEEARLARAHARREAGAPAQALEAYEDAVRGYRDEAQALQARRVSWRQPDWIDRILAAEPPKAFGAGQAAAVSEPALAALWPVLAGHPWQQAWQRLCDLDVARRWIEQAQRERGILQTMLEQRQATFVRREPALREQARGRGQGTDPGALDELRRAVDQAAVAGDGVAYATARERGLADTLARATAQLTAQLTAIATGPGVGVDPAAAALPSSTAPTSADVAGWADRVRLARGALAWQQARDFPLRQAPAVQALREAADAAAAARAHLARIDAARQTEPLRLQALSARIERLGRALDALAPQVAVLVQAQRAEVLALLDQVLVERQAQVAARLEQARWSVAELHDALRDPVSAGGRP